MWAVFDKAKSINKRLKGLSSEIKGGSSITSFNRSRFKDVLLGLFLKFYSAAVLYFSQIPLAEYNTKRWRFLVYLASSKNMFLAACQ
jgi:hypothetical protein